jgi:crescentin
MSKFGGLFTRKANAERAELAVVSPATPARNLAENDLDPFELDDDLFSVIGSQIGSENEVLRNLLLDVTAKTGELDNIKAAVSKLIDPVSKTLRAFEAEKSEKINLQTALNNARSAYARLRTEAAELEKKATATQRENISLKQELVVTQNSLRTVEAKKAEIDIDIAARKAQLADLETSRAYEVGESKILREENRRLDERLTTTDKRVIAVEAELNATRQRLAMTENEKDAQHAAFEKASAEAARLSRKLAETEAALTNTNTRLRSAETNFAEANNERARLGNALDEANERYEREQTTHRMRFDTLQARATATEKLLVEAREHLIARAEEIRAYDRRISELTLERNALQTRVHEMEADRLAKDSQFQEIDQARMTLMERSASLARAFTAKEANLAQSEETIASLNQRVGELEAEYANNRYASEEKIEELTASLRREKLERAVVEGALETCRKDFSRVMRELMALERQQSAAETPAVLQAANAA